MAHKFLLVVREKPVDDDFMSYKPELRLGNVAYHRDLLLKDDYRQLGGGAWEIDDKAKEIILDGESGDFGCPKFERIEKVIIPEEWKDYKITYTYPRYRLLAYGRDEETRTVDVSAIAEVGETFYM